MMHILDDEGVLIVFIGPDIAAKLDGLREPIRKGIEMNIPLYAIVVEGAPLLSELEKIPWRLFIPVKNVAEIQQARHMIKKDLKFYRAVGK